MPIPDLKEVAETDDVQELDRTLSQVETEWKREIDQRSMFRLLDLPPELQHLIYDYIAADSFIAMDFADDWSNWPAICSTSKQVRADIVPRMYRYAAFVAQVDNLDFQRVIEFVNYMPPKYRKLLQTNDKLTIHFSGLYSGAHTYLKSPISLWAWTQHCRVSTMVGNYVSWHYRADLVVPHLYNTPQPDKNDILQNSGYMMLWFLYQQLHDEYERYVIRRMLHAMWNGAEAYVAACNRRIESSNVVAIRNWKMGPQF